jgi:pre-mRNA-splicing helicase BRR2
MVNYTCTIANNIQISPVSRLADNLNVEIALGSVRNRDDAVQWLADTYL